MRYLVAFLLIPLFCLTLYAGEKKNRGPAGMKRGLAAHLFNDPEAWGGNWKEDAPPTVDPLEWTFRAYEATGLAPHINYRFIQRGWFSARLVGYLQVPPGLSDKKDKGGEETYEFMLELWADDAKALDGGKAAPKIVKGNVLNSRTKR